ncbi:MAG: hypothetical protein J6I38_00290 [Prevotella sp.]|nr:hypothetical protein [Prevotella sp.]
MAELNYLKELTLNFNLRKPTSKRPTNVYAVVKVCGKQIKIPTTCKINAYLWDSKKQVPMLLNSMSNVERDNAKQVFTIINSFQSAFSEYYCYFYQNFQEITSEEVRGFFEKNVLSKLMVNKNMAKNGVPNVKRERKATKALQKALELYPEVNDRGVKDSSIETYQRNLKNFINYCEDIKRDSVKMLTSKGLSDYEIWLRKKGKSNNLIRSSIRIVRILVNDVICKHPTFRNYGVEPLIVKLVKNIRSEGKQVELLDEEVAALENCKGLSPVQMEYRDLFLLECITGQRASDIPTLFNPSKYKIKDNCFSFITIKEKTPALVERTPKVLEIIDRYKDGFKHIDINNRFLSKYESINIKAIAKKAGLSRPISYQDNRRNIMSRPLFEIIASHFGRHTFCTKMARVVPIETLKYLTGHKTTQALKKYYIHLTDEDTINIVNEALNGGTKADTNKTGLNNSNPLNNLFAYNLLIHLDNLMKNNIDAFHTESTKQAIKIIKDVSTLNDYPEDIDKEKVISLDRIVFELSYYFTDAQLYSIFKYKELHFGIVGSSLSQEEVMQLFHQEDLERPKRKLLIDLEEWEKTH